MADSRVWCCGWWSSLVVVTATWGVGGCGELGWGWLLVAWVPTCQYYSYLIRARPAVGILPWQGGARADTIYRNSVCPCKK
ncbi:unnamed protein product [Prunus armeniaca]